MTLPMFIPPLDPAPQGTGYKINIKARRWSYSDGYEQRGEKGLNSRPRTATLVWPIVEEADANTIAGFLETNAVTGFRYAISLGGVHQWKVDENSGVDVNYGDGGLCRVSVNIVEIFDP